MTSSDKHSADYDWLVANEIPSDQHPIISPYWRFAEELNIIQATLLILGLEPQGLWTEIENRAERPHGYDAVRDSIVSAIRSQRLKGSVAHYVEQWFDNDTMRIMTREDTQICDFDKTFVDVEDLKSWLIGKGHNTGFFFPRGHDRAAYLDQNHDRYAPKLAAAVKVWLAYETGLSGRGSPKQKMQKWLRMNAPEFGLVSEDGKPTEGVIEEIARMANWATKGGAPRVGETVITEAKQEAPNSNLPEDDCPF